MRCFVVLNWCANILIIALLSVAPCVEIYCAIACLILIFIQSLLYKTVLCPSSRINHFIKNNLIRAFLFYIFIKLFTKSPCWSPLKIPLSFIQVWQAKCNKLSIFLMLCQCPLYCFCRSVNCFQIKKSVTDAILQRHSILFCHFHKFVIIFITQCKPYCRHNFPSLHCSSETMQCRA